MKPSEMTIAFVMYPGLTPLDLIGPLQVFSVLHQVCPEFRPVVVAERAGDVSGDNGIVFRVVSTFADVPHPYALLVPGGGAPTLTAMRTIPIRTYVKRTAASAEVVGSVCTGALILAAVGLLEGRPATTHWAYRGILNQWGASYRRERWVEDGKFITSAGVSAGIDAALRLAARLTDDGTAKTVQARLDYDPEPPYGGLNYDRIPLLGRAIRGYHTLAAPWLTRPAKRLTAAGR